MYDYISWNDVETAIDNLFHQIKDSKKEYTSIYGISRGGLVPAVLLSHRLNIPLVEVSLINHKTLIVDDIADSGKTLLSRFRSYDDVAVLFYRITSVVTPKFVGKTIKHSNWLIFPWETSESSEG
jgi:hypoxanthine phosphoribosyltransferase